jgi:hypothetical protein
MAEARPSGARRAAAVLVLLVMCAGLLATSYAPVESTLAASQALTATLTSDEPQATGRIRLALNAAALPVDDGVYRTDGVLTLDMPAHLSRVITMTVTGVDLTVVPGEEYGRIVIPIEQLCRVAEPCERELEISLEWLAPDSTSLSASVQANLEIVYHEREEAPDGAEVAITRSAEMTAQPGAPAIRSATEQELIVLDPEHWAAARHVVLTATVAAREGKVLAFLDQRVSQLPVRDVSVTIIPDDAPDETLEPDAPIDAFGSCPDGGECRRGFTVRFELRWAGAAAAASVHWSMGARASFPDLDEVPPDALLTAQVDGGTDARLDGALTNATASGAFEADGHAQVSIQIRANRAALPEPAFGYLPPTGHAVLKLTSTGHANVVVSVSEEETVGTARVLSEEAAAAEIFVNPLKTCPYEAACTRTIVLNVTTGRRDGSAGTAEISWELDLGIAYPDLQRAPADAEISLTPRRDG